MSERPKTRVIDDRSQATTLRLERYRLRVVGDGPLAGQQLLMTSGEYRVGAGPGNDWVLDDPTVSGAHLVVSIGAGGCRVCDLGSTNGSWLGPHRIVEACLAPGSVLRLGDLLVRFEATGETEEVGLFAGERFGDAIGQSLAMRRAFAVAAKVAPTDSTVLISGETGTGKEVLADAIVAHSARADGPLVVVDCGSIPATLVESELFGHERGAFTGAHRQHAGAFERASGGTLFLDEIGELPLELQPRLLRALEQRRIRRVGGSRELEIDVRFLAASNQDLAGMVARGEFRADLFYRLAVVHLMLPPLRKRRDDIPLLVGQFLDELGASDDDLPAGALDRFVGRPWPGNVRELRNAVERAVLVGEVEDPLAGDPLATPASGTPVIDLSVPFKQAKAELVEQFERAYVTRLLDEHDWNISAAARAARIDRMSLHKILTRLQLERG